VVVTSEDHEDAHLDVGREAVACTCWNEYRLPNFERYRLAFNIEYAAAVEYDVQLVVVVWLLSIGLRCDEDVHADLEARREMDDLIATSVRFEALLRVLDVEWHRGRRHAHK
jgi:hypothetical protein